MTKLIKIPFDASLIGQDGIVVKYGNGETPDFVKVYNGEVFSISENGQVRVTDMRGKLLFNDDCRIDLLMYRESKVMNVEEWHEEHPIGYSTLQMLRDFAAAIKNGEVEI